MQFLKTDRTGACDLSRCETRTCVDLTVTLLEAKNKRSNGCVYQFSHIKLPLIHQQRWPTPIVEYKMVISHKQNTEKYEMSAKHTTFDKCMENKIVIANGKLCQVQVFFLSILVLFVSCTMRFLVHFAYWQHSRHSHHSRHICIHARNHLLCMQKLVSTPPADFDSLLLTMNKVVFFFSCEIDRPEH